MYINMYIFANQVVKQIFKLLSGIYYHTLLINSNKTPTDIVDTFRQKYNVNINLKFRVIYFILEFRLRYQYTLKHLRNPERQN